jgi:hypothetical protein
MVDGQADGIIGAGLSSRIITSLLGLFFFLPVCLFLHNHFDLPIQTEIFAVATCLIIFIILMSFQSENEAKQQKKTR